MVDFQQARIGDADTPILKAGARPSKPLKFGGVRVGIILACSRLSPLVEIWAANPKPGGLVCSTAAPCRSNESWQEYFRKALRTAPLHSR